MHKSIVVSCDTYYYGLANDLGMDTIHRFMAQFGFGRAPASTSTASAGAAALAGVEDGSASGQQKWYAGDTISVGIGQGYNSLHAAAAGARRGHARQRRQPVYPPHMVRASQDARTQQIGSIAGRAGETARPQARARRAGQGPPWST